MTERAATLRTELAKAIVGQTGVVDDVLLTLFCGEHALLTGVPGLAKTLLIRSLADSVHLAFNRIQFTPDLMPTDITGTDIIQEDA
ncbi:MAG TPA: AAA family ATPase, partial [Luteolibacter sp.]